MFVRFQLGLTASALALGATLSGCIEAIPLGSECPSAPGVCQPMGLDAGRGASSTGPSTPPHDAAPADAARAPIEAAVPPESDPPEDAGGPRQLLLPALDNLSFEFTGSEPGDVTVIGPNRSIIAPWYTCQPIGGGKAGPLSAVRAERAVLIVDARDADASVAIDSIQPTDGDTFVSEQYFAGLLSVPLVQQLAEPLRAGEEYGFAIDVRATGPMPRLALSVYGADGGCLPSGNAHLLAIVQPERVRKWQTVCVRFVAPLPHTHLFFSVTSDSLLNGDRLFIDNIRQTAECETPPAPDEP